MKYDGLSRMKDFKLVGGEFEPFMIRAGLLKKVENFRQCAEVVLSAAGFCDSRRRSFMRRGWGSAINSATTKSEFPRPSIVGQRLAVPLSGLFECEAAWLYCGKDTKCVVEFIGLNDDAEIAAWMLDYLLSAVEKIVGAHGADHAHVAREIGRYFKKCIENRDVVKNFFCKDTQKDLLKIRWDINDEFKRQEKIKDYGARLTFWYLEGIYAEQQKDFDDMKDNNGSAELGVM